jgi:exodeoxyribonuclease V alpha subunit
MHEWDALWEDLELEESGRALVRGIAEAFQLTTPGARLALSLVLQASAQGAPCVRPEEEPHWLGADPLRWPSQEHWERLLVPPLVGPGAPLVRDSFGLLYLNRIYHDQSLVVARLAARLRQPLKEVNLDRADSLLDQLFTKPTDGIRSSDGQRLAAALSLLRSFLVITGGPGTGKTTTVAKILALLLQLSENPAQLRIMLLAPTGKAAARLVESLRSSQDDLSLPTAVRQFFPDQPSTIHRALGLNLKGRARYHERNPLPADLVIVDETSMVDLSLFAKLVVALPPSASLILLGDPHQLASVEAGAILGDLHEDPPCFSNAMIEKLACLGCQPLPTPGLEGPLQDASIHLQKSFRFGGTSKLGSFAAACLRGEGETAWRELQPIGDELPEEAGVFLCLGPWRTALENLVHHFYAPALRTGDLSERMERMSRFRVLTPHRQTEMGVLSLNELIQSMLARKNLISPSSALCHGQPLLVLENDYDLGLFNGDQGILHGENQPKAYFPSTKAPKEFSPVHLPAWEPCFAMTVHKSQGSEYEAVAVLLPPQPGPHLTRELVYTAVTRARRQVFLIAWQESFCQAIASRTRRSSGLRLHLQGD